jgi:hypothetical protein
LRSFSKSICVMSMKKYWNEKGSKKQGFRNLS